MTGTPIDRVPARVVLALIGIFALLVLLLPGGKIVGIASAQTTPTASPSPTRATTGPQIEILNPNTGTSAEASIKTDVDNLYHLNSVAAEASGASVTYELLDADGVLLGTIGTATPKGPDAYEYLWDFSYQPPTGARVTTIPDGSYILRATLNSSPSDSDSQSFRISNTGPSPADGDTEAQAETVEITRPTNGSGLGVHARGTTATFVLEGTASAATTFVKGLYTTSPPGNEPTWTTCTESYVAATDTNTDAAGDQVRILCTLAAADLGRAGYITGVAMVANDTSSTLPPAAPKDPDDSGDAHRVLGYIQLVRGVALIPASQTVNEGMCANTFTATVTDQQNAPMARVNVDVHGLGPTDNLRFDVSGANGRSAAQAPNNNHVATEGTRDCGVGTAPGAADTAALQGEHNDILGLDRKHIESTTGTDLDGRFFFTLFSPDTGTTRVAAWADTADDDLWCPGEFSAAATITWRAPSAVPDLTNDTCGGTPPGSTTQSSATPTPTRTTAATPTPTTTPRPNPRGCTLMGTDASDRLEGTSGRDVICGLGGNDVIIGAGGNDVLYGDSGHDEITGGGGDDEMYGAGGSDLLAGGSGSDFASGGASADLITGGSGNDRFSGGGGPDELQGGAGGDSLTGNGGADRLRGGKSNDRLRGNSGNDRLNGGPGRDNCRGGAGRDRLTSC